MARLHPHPEQCAQDDLVFEDDLLEEAFGVAGPHPAEHFECLNLRKLLVDEFIDALDLQGRQDLGEL